MRWISVALLLVPGSLGSTTLEMEKEVREPAFVNEIVKAPREYAEAEQASVVLDNGQLF